MSLFGPVFLHWGFQDCWRNVLISFDDDLRSKNVDVVRSIHRCEIFVVEIWKTYILEVVFCGYCSIFQAPLH